MTKGFCRLAFAAFAHVAYGAAFALSWLGAELVRIGDRLEARAMPKRQGAGHG